ncbi:MAG: thiamine diphosphokinase [Clostridia bacterium]|nr:thiamine diphosphokinase [Clostridia bacterium]
MQTDNKICCIIGAGDAEEIVIPSGAFVIAADGGLNKLKGVTPHLVVGDFDSLGFLPEGDNILRLPVEKDVTDTACAIEQGEARGADTFLIYGGTGGRPDHTLANISLLIALSKRGKQGYLIGEGYVTTAITDRAFGLPLKASGTVSVFSGCDKALGVFETGLKYSLDNYILTADNPLGVSNSFTGQPAEVSVKTGTLIVMWEEKDLKNFVDNI